MDTPENDGGGGAVLWTIDYGNDTGPGDEGFWEWWTVTNGVRSFQCESEEDARFLAAVLAKAGGAA